MYNDLLTPTVIIELDIVERNIENMLEITKQNNIKHRPHIKAHKSIYFAQEQLRRGCVGITCAKLTEAEVMVEHGIKDILIAFPIIGKAKIERLGALIDKADITNMINSIEGAIGLSELGVRMGKKLKTLIEVDGGINRGGIMPGEPTLEFARKVKDLSGLDVCGLLYYGGTIYGENTEEGIIEKTKKERRDLLETQKLLNDDGFSITILSTGSSYSARMAEHLEGVTEVRSGNYIFNDGSTLWPGLVREEDCALRILSTVVSKPDSYTAIIDAGTKTLTSDTGAFTKGYGYVIDHPEITIYKLNEEHGFMISEKPNDLKVGDVIEIIPNHACVIPNLNDTVYGVRNGKVEVVIPVDARGKNI